MVFHALVRELLDAFWIVAPLAMSDKEAIEIYT